MILVSKNDPGLYNMSQKEENNLISNPNIILAQTEYGGHLGFFKSYTSCKK